MIVVCISLGGFDTKYMAFGSAFNLTHIGLAPIFSPVENMKH